MTVPFLENISEFRVPARVIDATDAQLRQVGMRGAECFVLWVGKPDASKFQVEDAYIPAQDSYHLRGGLCVTVDGDELHRLNKWLYSYSMTLGAQVHSHPTAAFHSDTDSTYPIVTQRGGLSIVVPDFGQRGVRGRGVECYRLGAGGWQHLRRRAVRRLIHIESHDTEDRT